MYIHAMHIIDVHYYFFRFNARLTQPVNGRMNFVSVIRYNIPHYWRHSYSPPLAQTMAPAVARVWTWPTLLRKPVMVKATVLGRCVAAVSLIFAWMGLPVHPNMPLAVQKTSKWAGAVPWMLMAQRRARITSRPRPVEYGRAFLAHHHRPL